MKKPNNYFLDPTFTGFPSQSETLIEVLRNHPIWYALSAHKPIAETYATQFLLSAYDCNMEDVGITIVGYVLHPKVKNLIPLQISVDDLRTALNLPQLEFYAPTPDDNELMEFLRFHSYTPDPTKPLRKRTDFRRKGLPPI